MRRWKDWLRQSERKLGSAKWDLKGEFFEDACFSAQQAAELTRDEEMLERARILDQYYIPTRYPNGFDVGAPMDYYTEKQAKGAIEYAEDIIEFVKREVE